MLRQDSVASWRSNKHELYQRDLNACIEGVANFPVTKRQTSAGACSMPLSLLLLLLTITAGGHLTSPVAKCAVDLFTPVDASHSLPSPPQSPTRQQWPTQPPPASQTEPLNMDRSYLHGGPMRGNAGPARGPENVRPSQDARVFQDAGEHLAVQPASNPGNLKLKKAAVKIVTPAGQAPGPAPGPPLHKFGGAVLSKSHALAPVGDLKPEAKMYVKITLRRLTDTRVLN